MLRLLAGLLAAQGSVSRAQPSGGARYHTTHALTEPLEADAHTFAAFPDRQIREWHMHTYFNQHNDASVASALRLQEKLIAAVASGELVVVCDGITDALVPGLNSSEVPPINMEPIGPHPAGSFETWVPAEHVAAALSLFMLHREELSILLHPLTAHAIEDHTGRSMWLGEAWPIDRTVLHAVGSDPPQYVALGLGYSAAGSGSKNRRLRSAAADADAGVQQDARQ